MKRFDQLLFQLHQPSYLWLGRAQRKLRRQYETERQKHQRERRTADYLLISPTNCGLTWLRAMVGRILQVAYDVQDVNLHYLFSFSERNPYLPQIKAIHEKYGQFGTYEQKRVILLVRDPRDALVSKYHQHKQNYATDYPDINAFILEGPELAAYVNDYNRWYENRHGPADFITVRYEDMRADTYGELERIIAFLQLTVTPEVIHSAIEFGSFKNMRSLEVSGSSVLRARVLQTGGQQTADNQRKVRKGLVGGYKQELSDQAIDHMNGFIQAHLHPTYGYGTAKGPVQI